MIPNKCIYQFYYLQRIINMCSIKYMENKLEQSILVSTFI